MHTWVVLAEQPAQRECNLVGHRVAVSDEAPSCGARETHTYSGAASQSPGGTCYIAYSATGDRLAEGFAAGRRWRSRSPHSMPCKAPGPCQSACASPACSCHIWLLEGPPPSMPAWSQRGIIVVSTVASHVLACPLQGSACTVCRSTFFPWRGWKQNVHTREEKIISRDIRRRTPPVDLTPPDVYLFARK